MECKSNESCSIIVDFTKKVKDIPGKNLSKIILYGSYARGEQRDNSDVDFMILTALTEDEIEKIEPILYDMAFELELNYCIDKENLIGSSFKSNDSIMREYENH